MPIDTQTTVFEGSTCQITATLQDEAGDAIASNDLTTLTLTLYDKKTGAVINSVSDTNILNTGRGSVNGSGVLTLTLTPDDNPIVGSSHGAGNIELHIAMLKWTWNEGTKAGHAEILVPVQNLLKVT